jgi:hypothetical protein
MRAQILKQLTASLGMMVLRRECRVVLTTYLYPCPASAQCGILMLPTQRLVRGGRSPSGSAPRPKASRAGRDAGRGRGSLSWTTLIGTRLIGLSNGLPPLEGEDRNNFADPTSSSYEERRAARSF